MQNRAPATNLTADERRARVAALRGIVRARDASFEAASRAFADAIRLDPALDLVTVPGFWKLTSRGQQAAIDAYEREGRGHDPSKPSDLARRFQRLRLVGDA